MLQHMATITLKSLVDDQIAGGVAVEAGRCGARSRARSPVVPLRTTAPNSVFAFGRSFGH